MGDTSNWEFAAAVAGVSIGLGGLLLFTLIGAIGSWRIFNSANRAAVEAEKANMEVQNLARHLTLRETQSSADDLGAAALAVGDLQRQATALMDQQIKLQNAVRNLVEAGVLGREGSQDQHRELESALRRLEEHLDRVASAVARLGQRP